MDAIKNIFEGREFYNKESQFLLIELGTILRKQARNAKKISGKTTRLTAKLRAHKLISV